MRMLLAALALAALGACGGRDRHVTSDPPQAELIVEATNEDPVDYALWLEWQDDTGAWNQDYLFSVFGDVCVGPRQDFSDRIVLAGVAYSVLLADPAGNVYDRDVVMMSENTLVDLHYCVVGRVLLRQAWGVQH
jgi:hypothetical protein